MLRFLVNFVITGILNFSRLSQLMALIVAGLKANPSDRSVFSPHACNCWCTQWVEFHIRRPTGNLSWIMRLQNEQDLMAMFPDFALSDISNLFLPFSADDDPEPHQSVDTGKMWWMVFTV